MARLLGRHIFTASLAQQANETVSTNWNNWLVGTGYGPTSTFSVGQASRDAVTVSYLGDRIPSNAASASGLNLPRITAIQVPVSANVMQWNTDAADFISYSVPIVNPNDSSYTDDTRPYTQARKYKDVIDSTTLVWQGWFFDGSIVPMVGWRKDKAKSYDAGSPNKVGGLVTNFADPGFQIPSEPSNAVDGDTTTWSVVGRLPRSMVADLPYGLDVSVFYSESSNFQPDASRVDIVGQAVPSPSGETQDYGFMVSALQNKVSFKVNWYKTSVTNATLSGELGNAYLIGAGEAWCNVHAQRINRDINGQGYDSWENFGTTTSGKVLRWEPANADRVDPSRGFNGDPNSPDYNPYTQAAIDAQYNVMVASVQDFLAKAPSADFKQAWGMTDWDAGGGSWSMNSVAVTGDTVSEGVEFELTAQPVNGLQISINASKTDAKRVKIGKAYSDWIEQRYQDYQGPMGDMRMWGGGNWAMDVGSGGTLLDKFNNETYPAYKLALALNDSSVPELRPWRFNLVTNYGFQEGPLKGANVGMGYRWVDKNVTGFPLNSAEDGYDVNNPYYGGSEDAFDLWAGYGFNIFSDKVKMRVQLNVRNLTGDDQLIPVTVQPDGSPAAYRIAEPRTFTLNTTFEF